MTRQLRARATTDRRRTPIDRRLWLPASRTDDRERCRQTGIGGAIVVGWVMRAFDGSVNDLPSALRGRGSSVRNNSDRTARVYEKRDYSGPWVCVTRSGGSVHDLRSYNLSDQTRSLRIDNNDRG
ncbi:peptidase inhibitor family I36 protein [Streptomyces sp. NPDC004134]|uniref:peptidase inhibitor family I36 protein n=1 Tax=Streptomyces sp. NPDC004134 TaxID=3364691 RepID=UPI0036783FBD